MIYIARSYHEDKAVDELSIRYAQLMRKVINCKTDTGFNAIKPKSVGAIAFAKIALFPYEWFKDEVCIRQVEYFKREGLPFFFSLEKLEQYLEDMEDGVIT